MLRDDAPREIHARIRAALSGAIESAGAIPSSVHVEAVAGIEREPGNGAKLRLVKTLGAAS